MKKRKKGRLRERKSHKNRDIYTIYKEKIMQFDASESMGVRESVGAFLFFKPRYRAFDSFSLLLLLVFSVQTFTFGFSFWGICIPGCRN